MYIFILYLTSGFNRLSRDNRKTRLGTSKCWDFVRLKQEVLLHHILPSRKISNISRTLVGNKIVDNSDVVGASPVGAAPTTSSFSN